MLCGIVQGKHISIPSVVPVVMNTVTDIAVFGVDGIISPSPVCIAFATGVTTVSFLISI